MRAFCGTLSGLYGAEGVYQLPKCPLGRSTRHMTPRTSPTDGNNPPRSACNWTNHLESRRYTSAKVDTKTTTTFLKLLCKYTNEITQLCLLLFSFFLLFSLLFFFSCSLSLLSPHSLTSSSSFLHFFFFSPFSSSSPLLSSSLLFTCLHRVIVLETPEPMPTHWPPTPPPPNRDAQ